MKRDHPRGCGAHPREFEELSPGEGSSPRVRGSQRLVKAGHILDGIIPAGAGLTEFARLSGLSKGDHPRGCGAHQQNDATHGAMLGSSPRVRGSHGVRDRGLARTGIIPAGAGLTSLNK